MPESRRILAIRAPKAADGASSTKVETTAPMVVVNNGGCLGHVRVSVNGGSNNSACKNTVDHSTYNGSSVVRTARDAIQKVITANNCPPVALLPLLSQRTTVAD